MPPRVKWITTSLLPFISYYWWHILSFDTHSTRNPNPNPTPVCVSMLLRRFENKLIYKLGIANNLLYHSCFNSPFSFWFIHELRFPDAEQKKMPNLESTFDEVDEFFFSLHFFAPKNFHKVLTFRNCLSPWNLTILKFSRITFFQKNLRRNIFWCCKNSMSTRPLFASAPSLCCAIILFQHSCLPGKEWEMLKGKFKETCYNKSSQPRTQKQCSHFIISVRGNINWNNKSMNSYGVFNEDEAISDLCQWFQS